MSSLILHPGRKQMQKANAESKYEPAKMFAYGTPPPTPMTYTNLIETTLASSNNRKVNRFINASSERGTDMRI